MRGLQGPRMDQRGRHPDLEAALRVLLQAMKIEHPGASYSAGMFCFHASRHSERSEESESTIMVANPDSSLRSE